MHNLLFLLTVVFYTVFVILWVNEQELSFRRNFIFCRKKNMMREISIAVKYILLCGVACVAFYYLICLIRSYHPLMPLNMLFPFVFIIAQFIVLDMLEYSLGSGVMILFRTIFTLIPYVLVIFQGILDMEIDQYCNYMIAALVLFDILMGRKLYYCWMKGDIRT